MQASRHLKIGIPTIILFILLSIFWSSTRLSLDFLSTAGPEKFFGNSTPWTTARPTHENHDLDSHRGEDKVLLPPADVKEGAGDSLVTPSYIPSSELPPQSHSPSPPSFREQLTAIKPYPDAPYGPETLSVFQRIWVLTLEGMEDRHKHMSSLADALGLNFTYHYGRNPFQIDEDRRVVQDIGTYTHWFREQAAFEEEQPLNEWGNRKIFKFEWSDDAAPGNGMPVQPDDLQGADLWLLPDTDPRKPPLPDDYPRYILEFDGKGGLDSSKGRPAPEGVWGDSELSPNPPSWGTMTPARVACYLSHYEVIRKIAESEMEGPQLILEDDVDMEWDIHHRLRQMWQHLPPWDFVYLGHCYANGNDDRLPHTPYLRWMHNGMCTHAYAMTPHGARRLVRFLRSPLFAFGRPIDHIVTDLLHGFSRFIVEPPVVVQMPKDVLPSALGTGEFIQWLADSVVARIKKVEEANRKDKQNEPIR